jgi:hypothetical protein
MTWRRSLVSGIVGVAALVGAASTVAAQTQVTGPTVSLDRYELAPGERVKLTIAGFRSQVVDMMFCGNEGRRGSVDCDVRGTQSREMNSDGSPTPAEMPVTAPPTPCPCIVRVASSDNREVVVAPITLIGHPVAEVVNGSQFDAPLSVDIIANAAPQGLSDQVRSSLGGATTYDVTVQITNSGNIAVAEAAIDATFNRTSYDDIRTIDLPAPGSISPGQTWQQTVQVEVPALTFGTVRWTATASGSGPSATATDTTQARPVLLYLFATILLIDVAVLLWRLAARSWAGGEDDPADDEFSDDPFGPDTGDADQDLRRPELVT